MFSLYKYKLPNRKYIEIITKNIHTSNNYNIPNINEIPQSLIKMREKMRKIHNIESTSYTDSHIDSIVDYKDNNTTNKLIVNSDSIPNEKIDVTKLTNKYLNSSTTNTISQENIMPFPFGTIRLDAANKNRIYDKETIVEEDNSYTSPELNDTEIKEIPEVISYDQFGIYDSSPLENVPQRTDITKIKGENKFGDYDSSYNGISNQFNKDNLEANKLEKSYTQSTFTKASSIDTLQVSNNTDELNYFDQQISIITKDNTNKIHQEKSDFNSEIKRDTKLNAFDEEYFSTTSNIINEKTKEDINLYPVNYTPISVNINNDTKVNAFDEEYFAINTNPINEKLKENNNNYQLKDTSSSASIKNDNKLNAFDDEYFSNSSNLKNDISSENIQKVDISINSGIKNDIKLNAFDEEYFPINSNMIEKPNENKVTLDQVNDSTSPVSVKNDTKVNAFDEEYFTINSNPINEKLKENKNNYQLKDTSISATINKDNKLNVFDEEYFSNSSNVTDLENKDKRQDKASLNSDTITLNEDTKEESENLIKVSHSIAEKNRIAYDRKHSKLDHNDNKEKSAYDVALELRRKDHQQGITHRIQHTL